MDTIWGIKAQAGNIGFKMWENKAVDPSLLLWTIFVLLFFLGIYLLYCLSRYVQNSSARKELLKAQTKIIQLLEDEKITPQECGELLAALIESKKSKDTSGGKPQNPPPEIPKAVDEPLPDSSEDSSHTANCQTPPKPVPEG